MDNNNDINIQMTYTPEGALKNLSVDCVIFGFEKSQLEVLLIKLAVEPSLNRWALPGGNVLVDEELEQATQRVLNDLTGVDTIYLEQLAAFGEVTRFPLFRVITIGYYALVKPENYILKPGPHASQARWFKINEVPELPFDHNLILKTALDRLKKDIRYKPVGFELLPPKFTLTQLQTLYESILGRELDKRNFRKKILAMKLLQALDEKEQGVAHRAARLYRFDTEIYENLKQKEVDFEL